MTEENTTTATVYELGYHVLPTVAADDVDAKVGELRSAIEKHGGSFIAESTPEMTDLAYTMYTSYEGKRTAYTKAYFGWIKFELPASEMDTLKEEIEGHGALLRSVIFKTTREDTRADAQMASGGILREVETTGTIQKRAIQEEGGEVSEEAIERSIGELVGSDYPKTEGAAPEKTDETTDEDATDTSTEEKDEEKK